MHDPVNSVYSNKINTYSLLLDEAKKSAKKLSFLRLGVFLSGVILTYIFAVNHSWWGLAISLLIAIIVFLFLIKKHGKILQNIKRYQTFKEINTLEQQALGGDFSAFDPGNEFENYEHPFSADLDIFGEASLFQFLNRSASLSGKKQLADKLMEPETNTAIIKEQQEAILSLAPNIDWRQNFEAIGKIYKEKEPDKKNIMSWVSREAEFQSILFTPLLFLVPVATLSLIILALLGIIAPQLFFLYLFIPWGIAGSQIKKVNRIHNQVGKTSEMLAKYSLLFREIENLDNASNYILALQKKLLSNNIKSSTSIKQLSSILSALDNRLNPVSWALFNAFSLWDILQVRRLEKWQQKHRNSLAQWFYVLAETDAISCFGNYAYNHPKAIAPAVKEGKFEIQAKAMGHPLIHESARVCNDLEIQPDKFIIITGANMAGKSTFLRTVGVNLIMAMCGAPICADSFSFAPIRIFSSIRTHDSLAKNESYFYAELKRLQHIIDELKQGKTLFVILDEILKGTNSKDKHAGSEALIKQLLSYHTGGIIATHDVSLGELAKLFPNQVKTFCFEVDIKGDELLFDYKIRDGISKNMNATLLMKKMGITI